MLRFLIFSAAFTALYGLAVLTSGGQRVDTTSLGSFPALREGIWMELYSLRHPGLLALCAVAALSIVYSAFRGRYAVAGRACAVIVITAFISLGLDVVLIRPDLGSAGYLYNTYPSGHAALSLAAVVAVASLRPWRHSAELVVALAIGAFAVGMFSLFSFAHRASDIAGGILLVGAVSALVDASSRGMKRTSRSSERATRHRSVSRVSAVSGVVLLATCVCVLIAGLSPEETTASLIGIATIAACGALIVEITVHAWEASREQRELTDSCITATPGRDTDSA